MMENSISEGNKIETDIVTYEKDTMELLDDLNTSNQKIIRMTFLITCFGRTKKQLDNLVSRVRGIVEQSRTDRDTEKTVVSNKELKGMVEFYKTQHKDSTLYHNSEENIKEAAKSRESMRAKLNTKIAEAAEQKPAEKQIAKTAAKSKDMVL